ncbi:MAG: hypothetical protein CME34_04995 [Gordonia sp.]|nr:hypothetical protein [Gordonia sp. (in: high G+C Gram-positive bacteria)]
MALRLNELRSMTTQGTRYDWYGLPEVLGAASEGLSQQVTCVVERHFRVGEYVRLNINFLHKFVREQINGSL